MQACVPLLQLLQNHKILQTLETEEKKVLAEPGYWKP